MKTIKHLFQNPLQRHASDFTTTRQNSLALRNNSEMFRASMIGNDKVKHFIFDGLEAQINGNYFDITQGSIKVNVGEIWQAKKIQEDPGEEGTINGTWEVNPVNYGDTLEFDFSSPDNLVITDNLTTDVLTLSYIVDKGIWKDGIYKCTVLSGSSSFFPVSGDFEIYIEFDGKDLIIYSYSSFRPEYTDYIFVNSETKIEEIQWSGATDIYNILQARLYYDYGYEVDVDIIDPVVPAVINQFARKNNRELKIEFSIKSSSGAIQLTDPGWFKLAEFSADPNTELKPISDLENWVEQNDTIEFIYTYYNHRTKTEIDHPDGSVTEIKLFSSVREKLNTASVIDNLWDIGVIPNIKNELNLIINNGTSQFEIQTGEYKSKLNSRGTISDNIIYLDFLDPEFIQVGTGDGSSGDFTGWETGAFSGDGTTYQLVCDGSPSKIVNGSVEIRADFNPYSLLTVTYDAGPGTNTYDVNTATGLVTKYGTVPDNPKIKYQYYQLRYDIIQGRFDPITLIPIIEIKKGTIANGGLRNDNVSPNFPDPDTDFISFFGIKAGENQTSFTLSSDTEDLRLYTGLKIEETKGPIIYGSLKDYEELNISERTFLEFYGKWEVEGYATQTNLVKLYQEELFSILQLNSLIDYPKASLSSNGELVLYGNVSNTYLNFYWEEGIEYRTLGNIKYQLTPDIARFNIPIDANEGIKTTDTADEDILKLYGGHTFTSADGGYIELYGESHATEPGNVIIGGANGTNKGEVKFYNSGNLISYIDSNGFNFLSGFRINYSPTQTNAYWVSINNGNVYLYGSNDIKIFPADGFVVGSPQRFQVGTTEINSQLKHYCRAGLGVEGNLTVDGDITSTTFFDTSGHYRVDGTQVVGNRITGWGTQTSPPVPARTDVWANASTITDIIAIVSYLVQDLQSHGLIG